VGKNPIFLSNSFKIHFIKNPIYLKFILLDLDFNLIYILYILWIEYPLSESGFSKMDNLKNSIKIFNINFYLG